MVAAVVVGLLAVAGLAFAFAVDHDDQVRTTDATTTTATSEPSDWSSALLVSCGGPAYPREALASPTGVEDDDDAAAVGLRALIADPDGIGPIPKAGWRRLYDEGGRVVFSNGEFGDDFYEVELEEEDDGTYGFNGSSMGCHRARVEVGDDRSLATFTLPEGEVLSPDTVTFTVSVQEGACTGGQPVGDRLAKPKIEYGTETVGLLFTADSLPAGTYTCPGNPGQDVEVRLDEPLGSRKVVDLSSYPPKDPTAAEE